MTFACEVEAKRFVNLSIKNLSAAGERDLGFRL